MAKNSATNYSKCLPFIAFFFAGIAPKKKSFAKRKTPFFRSSRGASAFEKAEQNNREKANANIHDQSKFEIITVCITHGGGKEIVKIEGGIAVRFVGSFFCIFTTFEFQKSVHKSAQNALAEVRDG